VSATLSEIAASAPGVIAVVGADVMISDITHTSQDIGPGGAFVAIRGERFDAHRFIGDAVASGASALIVEEPVAADVPHIVVEDSRLAMAPMARAVHNNPDESLSIVGITGTNGKTSVVPLNRTTPESTDLQRLLAAMVSDGVESVAMEVSSHALDLHRADAVSFTSAGFTNLTQDHLDFHGTMDDYFSSKAKLFRAERTRSAVINIDDHFGERLAREVAVPVITVGFGESEAGATAVDISASGLAMSESGTSFTLQTPAGSALVALPIAGSFNVSNALVAVGLLMEDGLGIDDIVEGLENLGPISGRMEIVPSDEPFTVVVDYAHTPDAISAVLASVRSIVEARLIVIVGAGGDRDQDKRSLMGASAARFADLTIVTTDNPRSEDPRTIADEVARGAEAAGRSQVMTMLDRAEAIEHAIDAAGQGDVVMILGRGHEQGQEIAGRIVPFSDAQVAARALEGSRRA
jgi:UDP-N-acetylmuramoyl-L-alanyl-D-glutamate--2,6-diaminopimelate ligase